MPEAPRAASTDAAPAHLGAPSQFILPRVADRDLKFSGWRLAHETASSVVDGIYHATDVEIYATVGGRIITHVVGYGLTYQPTDVAPASRVQAGDGWSYVMSDAHRMELDALDTSRLVPSGVRAMVGVHEDGEGALAALKKTNVGKLGRLSKAAWIAACAAWPSLAEMGYEIVE
jgi:hypothetical protein